MPTRAQIMRRFWRLSPTAHKLRRQTRPFAEAAENRAFQFHYCSDGSCVEVRVWPGGKTRLTVVS